MSSLEKSSLLDMRFPSLMALMCARCLQIRGARGLLTASRFAVAIHQSNLTKSLKIS